jgi:hypothetical protein
MLYYIINDALLLEELPGIFANAYQKEKKFERQNK